MPVTVNANGLSVVHRGSSGIASATMPDVCKTPSPPGSPTPVPYPNVAMSSDLMEGTVSVTVDGQMAAVQGSKFVKSTGDEAGVAGGVISNVFIMEATFISFSPTVSMDGRPVCRLSDKMLMNRGNTACLGGEMQAPVLVPMCPPVQPPEVPKPCVFEHLTVKCDHESRKYQLKAYEHVGATLQVIADKGPEKIHVTFDGSCGVSHQSPGCAKVHILGSDDRDRVVEGAIAELELTRAQNRFTKDWLALLEHFVDPDHFPRDQYTIYGATCGGTGKGQMAAGEYAVVEVFPNAAWEAELEFSYKHDKKALSKTKTSFRDLDKQSKFELKGKMTATVGRMEMVYETGLEGHGANSSSDPLSQGFFKSTQWFLNKLAAVFFSLDLFSETKLDIRWPDLKFGGGIELAEVEESPKVRAQGKLYFDANPLIGAQFKLDILEWLIKMAGPLGGPGGVAFAEFLLKIKRNLAEKKTSTGAPQSDDLNVTAEIGIILTVGGDIRGGLGWTIVDGHPTVDSEKARIEAGIDFKLEAIVKADVKAWVIKAGAGASLSVLNAAGTFPSRASGKVFAKSGPGFPISGAIEYNGLAIYYAYFLDIGAEAAQADAPATGGSLKPSAKVGPTSHAIKESKCLCKLVEARTWPTPETKNVAGAVK